MTPTAAPRVIAELHVTDFERALEFYTLLGFTLRRREERYVVLELGSSLLTLYGGAPDVAGHSYFGRFAADTKRGYAVEICVFVDDVCGMHERLKDEGCIVQPLTLRPWGRRDFRVEDPFGFYLRISEPYDPRLEAC